MSSFLQQLLAKEEHPGALLDSLMIGGIDGELARMVLSSSMWRSMPAACHMGESASNDFIPDSLDELAAVVHR